MEQKSAAAHLSATVHGIEQLNAETVAVRMMCPDIAYYKAGQYLRVHVDAYTVRYYSLASVAGIDEYLELHVRKGKAGSASRWFHEVLRVGDTVEIEAPQGGCFYGPEVGRQPLLLVSTGSGLAPHVGIVRAAMHRGHAAAVHLYHGVRHAHELYLVEELQCLAKMYPNFHYVPCLSGEVALGYRAGRSLDAALRDISLAAGWQVYLSGHAGMVEAGCRAALQAGVPFEDIRSDQLPRTLEAFDALAA